MNMNKWATLEGRALRGIHRDGISQTSEMSSTLTLPTLWAQVAALLRDAAADVVFAAGHCKDLRIVN